jgi:Ca2+ transporting ATPase
MLCIMVGPNSAIGQIMSTLNVEQEATPLQEKLEVIATDIGKIGTYAAVLTVNVLYLRFFVERFLTREFNLFGQPAPCYDKFCEGFLGIYVQAWLSYLIIGVTIIVVAIPEGLPLAVMISLSYSVKKMLIDKNFVKRLASCEIMGGANNICSDKTGTLT